MKHNRKRARGFAMVLALSFLVLMVAVATGVLAFGQQQMHAARMTRDYLKAKVIAETGLNVAYNDIRSSIERVGNYVGAETTFGDGSYAVTIEQVGESGDENIRFLRLSSLGKCGISEARATLAVRHRRLVNETVNPDLDAVLRNAVTSGSSITLGGSIYVGGDVASPVSIRINGNTQCIAGSAYAPSYKGKSSCVGGTIDNDPTRYAVDWGSILEIDAFLSHAVTWDGRSMSDYPANTIVYCPGEVNIAANGTFQCSIIAKGDIKMAGSVTQLQPGTYPALVSLTGSVKLSGTATTHGLVAALSGSGTVTNSGNGDIYGCVLSSGEFKDTGNWSIFYTALEIRPPGATDNSDLVEVVAWQ